MLSDHVVLSNAEVIIKKWSKNMDLLKKLFLSQKNNFLIISKLLKNSHKIWKTHSYRAKFWYKTQKWSRKKKVLQLKLKLIMLLSSISRNEHTFFHIHIRFLKCGLIWINITPCLGWMARNSDFIEYTKCCDSLALILLIW